MTSSFFWLLHPIPENTLDHNYSLAGLLGIDVNQLHSLRCVTSSVPRRIIHIPRLPKPFNTGRRLLNDFEARLLSNWSDEQAFMAKEESLAALDRFRLLFTLLDKIWSSVRDHEVGLLPTEEQQDGLKATIAVAKRVWLEVSLNIVHNPKAHTLFDGHLSDQVRLHGGLADNADNEIERAHQFHAKLDRLINRLALLTLV